MLSLLRFPLLFNKRHLECLAWVVLLQAIGKGEGIVQLVVLEDVEATIQDNFPAVVDHDVAVVDRAGAAKLLKNFLSAISERGTCICGMRFWDFFDRCRNRSGGSLHCHNISTPRPLRLRHHRQYTRAFQRSDGLAHLYAPSNQEALGPVFAKTLECDFAHEDVQAHAQLHNPRERQVTEKDAN